MSTADQKSAAAKVGEFIFRKLHRFEPDDFETFAWRYIDNRGEEWGDYLQPTPQILADAYNAYRRMYWKTTLKLVSDYAQRMTNEPLKVEQSGEYNDC